ncbi:TetR/AcrR family transcriptional regulator [Variovorax boronicumulans]|uniref:TetR/AcrR family transcriptional regulator n=1 Tax=Variovorax boronicumulans TaxID=436515 RepID=UPI002781379A|nr:TetR/AcrR family transcriptional regulator [Variovorax boronicumulans]MDQ0040564.1 AcrR family transcriptional regulator [Variovorax boronicumulans]
MHAKLQRRQTLTDARRALVLDAARTVFSEAGIEGASIREIAKKAGYTPGAIYSYFESKEAIYAALLDESLLRLQAAVAEAKEFKSWPDKTLAAKAQAWFDFYAANPRDLDLGFYLVHGMRPRGLTSELDHELNDRLYDALRPCEDALLAMGLDDALALQENTALFAHGVGLLLMQHTGRIRMFRQSADALFKTYLAQLTQRSAAPAMNEDAGEPVEAGQPDLFGGTVQPNSTDT